jgi:hypothetical protein
MVAAQTAGSLKSLPSKKEIWLTEYKTYIIGKANTYDVYNMLRGQDPEPLKPEGEEFLNFEINKQKFIFDTHERWKKRKNLAWDFISRITADSDLKYLMNKYGDIFDSKAAWEDILDYYDRPKSISQQAHLEKSMSKIKVKTEISDIKLAFNDVINELEIHCNLLKT